jgi:uncharacterized protein (DUF1778 family)
MGKEFVFFFSNMTRSKRDTNLTIRLSQTEKLAWQEKADLSGMTISDLIRQAISRTKTWTVADKSLVKEQTRQIARIGNNLNQIAKWANTYKSTAEAVQIIQALRLIEQSLSRLSTKPSQPSSSNHSENSNDVS